jgi:hypothetical protein
VGDEYFQPGFLVAFTRFNFLARRAFFHAMHLDLHAIREAVNELERLGFATVDCRDAGLTESESLEQVRHVVHQWKTPFRAPYSGGSSFLQLILLRHALQHTLESARSNAPVQAQAPVPPPVQPAAVIAAPVKAPEPEPVLIKPEEDIKVVAVTASEPELKAAPVRLSEEEIHVAAAEPVASKAPEPDPSDLISRPAHSAAGFSEPSAEVQAEEENYLVRCVADITEQLQAVPAKNSPAVSAIVLGGCKLLIATWEAQAFVQSDETSKVLQRTVAARTILHVCMERHRKNEPTDLTAALDIARGQVEEMKVHVEAAKEAKNIDAAVNLAATTKRLLSLIAEGEKVAV